MILATIITAFSVVGCKNSSNTETASSTEIPESKAPITTEMLNAAQQTWCDALVLLGKTHEEGGDVKALATKILTDAYDYDNGTVLFKPTLAFGENTFRLDKEGALAYFIGGNPKYPEDKGFALKPWTKVRFDNAGEIIDGDIAISMGNVYLTDKSGKEIMVDKTFVFKRGADGKLRLIVHKSSLPFDPKQ